MSYIVFQSRGWHTCIDVNVDTFICMCRDGYFGVACSESKIKFMRVMYKLVVDLMDKELLLSNDLST